MSIVTERKKVDLDRILQQHGIRCPECGCVDLRVYKTSKLGSRIVRLRQCRHCGHAPIRTYESVAASSQ